MGIGVAISGGGHRATAWGWGAILGLAELGVNRDIVSIASVSGGSIANGVMAMRGDYASMSPDEVERAIAPGLRLVAHDGLFYFGPLTNRYISFFFGAASLAVGSIVSLLIAGLGAGRGWDLPWFLTVGLTMALAGWMAWLKTGKIPRKTRVTAVAALLASGPLTVAFLALTGDAHGVSIVWRLAVPVLVTVVLITSALQVFAHRSQVVDRALASQLFSSNGRTTALEEVQRSIHHVFCGTELQSGDHIYFTPRLVYSYRIGVGTPGSLHLSTAVQCSACLPGAFLPRRLPTYAFHLDRPWHVPDNEPEHPPEFVVVNDGGVYDNMADQWEQGFHEREGRVAGLSELQTAAKQLVVVNAGKGLGWRPSRRTAGISAEVRALSRTIDTLYNVSTSHRRQDLVRFQSADPLAGCLVHIAQSPFTVPNAFARSREPATAARAREALHLLAEARANEEVWLQRAERSPCVPTTLGALGSDVTADLLEHAFLLTVVNCYVILGVGRLPPSERLDRSRFDAMAQG
jgi:hypothetical protein